MKRILGLDLGSSSIGWAVVELGSDGNTIKGLGSRIIPLTTDDETQFSKGQAITKNADRTAMRTTRKMYDRYQMRRSNLQEILSSIGAKPVSIVKPIDLWRIRSLAATEKISIDELGRVLLHINQKRGYKSGKEDFNDSSSSKYVQSVNANYQYLVDNNLTLGQHFYQELLKDGSYRIKDRVYPRIAYIKEFDAIIANQREYYPEILTDELIHKIKDETIFFQRRLKSCKHLVSICDFEKKEYEKPDGSKVISGPKVAPKSSPVAQLCKVWEFVNTITVTNRSGDHLYISPDQKREIADFLTVHQRIKITDLQKILGITRKDGWYIDKTISQRNVGNNTYCRLYEIIGECYPELLKLNIVIEECADSETGEVRKIVAERIKTEPLFMLWHTLYSISDEEELRKVLAAKFGIDNGEILDNLCKIDFVKEGYSNKSNTAMRKVLPYLMEGYVYSDACACAGYNHSNWITMEDNLKRELQTRLEPIKKGELRQPIVEKILNQMVNVVNALMAEYDSFDEIRVELARELKQSREERERTTKMISQNERENQRLAKLVAEYSFTPTKSRIQKMKLWEETQHLCIYCNQPVSVTEFLSGIDVEREHIVPRSLLFDNSSNNVTCSCRNCNQEKGNKTAFDFIQAKGDAYLQEYTDRITALLEAGKISKAKYSRLMMAGKDIPSDFIDRQLRETQYISKKSLGLLKSICFNVYATSGSVTDYLRHLWGWDDVLHDLHFAQYKEAGLTTMKEYNSNGCTRQKEVIKGWTKRVDHRHHAVDALAIACTSQTVIQQLNNLNTLQNSIDSGHSIDTQKEKRHTNLDKFVLAQPHFSTTEVKNALESVLISYKSGKKVASPGKRYIYSNGKRVLAQTTIVPRGALSEQTVYGKIQINGEDSIVVKQSISSIDLKKAEKIVDNGIRKRVIEYLTLHNGKYDEKNPLCDHQGHQIRSVRIATGLSSVVPVRNNANGKPIGYVKPGNNHHIAIYRDSSGKLHEHIVTFWHAVERKMYGLPVVITNPIELSDTINLNLPDSFVSQLPDISWSYVESIQSNEMFVLGLDDELYDEAVRSKNTLLLSDHLYRVQKISTRNYVFRHHLETTVDDKYDGVRNERLSMQLGKLVSIRSLDSFFSYHPHKLGVNILGQIIND